MSAADIARFEQRLYAWGIDGGYVAIIALALALAPSSPLYALSRRHHVWRDDTASHHL